MYVHPTPGHPYQTKPATQWEQNSPETGDLVTAQPVEGDTRKTADNEGFSRNTTNTMEDGVTGHTNDPQVPDPENQVIQSIDAEHTGEGHPTETTTTPEGQTPNLSLDQQFTGQPPVLFHTPPTAFQRKGNIILGLLTAAQLGLVILNCLAAIICTVAYVIIFSDGQEKNKPTIVQTATDGDREDVDEVPFFFTSLSSASLHAVPAGIMYLQYSLVGIFFAVIGCLGAQGRPMQLVANLYFVPAIMAMLTQIAPFIAYYGLAKEKTKDYFGAFFLLPATGLYLLLAISIATTWLSLRELNKLCFFNKK